jgi:hypothetical protein
MKGGWTSGLVKREINLWDSVSREIARASYEEICLSDIWNPARLHP